MACTAHCTVRLGAWCRLHCVGGGGEGFASIDPYWKRAAPQRCFEQPMNNQENHPLTALSKIPKKCSERKIL